jgi:hypothetical protein
MNEEGLIYLGAALWLQEHGGALVVEHAPQLVVPFAMALRKAFDPPAAPENKER